MQIERRSPWTWLPPLAALILLVVIFVTGSNHSLFLKLNRFGTLFGADLWINLTVLGDGAIVLALIVPLIRQSPQRFWAGLVAAVVAVLWVQILKNAVNLPRPLGVLHEGQFFHTGPAFRAVSFPSGHSAAIFTFVGIWIMTLPGRHLLRFLLLALGILVCLSRVMVGVHWPLDLLGGMLGGWLAAWVGLNVAARRQWKTDGAAGFIAGAILLILSAALLVSTHAGYPTAMPFQRLLALVCLVWGAREMALMLPLRRLRTTQKRD